MSLFPKSNVPGILKQFVRFRSQRRSLGKPPGVARTLQQRLEELNFLDPAIHYKVDIGFARPQVKRRKVLSERVEILKQNKADLELKARKQNLLVPLDEVRREWNGAQTQAAAEHYHIYQHLYGDAYFTPALNVKINYPDGYPVYWGNLLTPTQAGTKPEVSFESKDSSYWTLALTTPDGHLASSDQEYVLWLVGNIPGNKVDKGEELVSYLQPFPVQGIGSCRYVFVLYKQEAPIDFKNDSPIKSSNWNDPSSRTFSTYDFYKRFESKITPAGLSFFQAEWDESVRTLFHKTFNQAEPVCCYDFPEPYRPKQTWFPLRQAFNLYMDRYRDEKQIAKEYLLRKLKHYDPWTGFKPQLQFPNAVPFKPNTPSWLKNEMIKERLGKARIQDY